jgi:hypothetical protein
MSGYARVYTGGKLTYAVGDMPSTIKRRSMYHIYKILVIVTTSHGVTSQLLHYTEYEQAENAYQALEESPELKSLKTTAIRLYKTQRGRYER